MLVKEKYLAGILKTRSNKESDFDKNANKKDS